MNVCAHVAVLAALTASTIASKSVLAGRQTFGKSSDGKLFGQCPKGSNGRDIDGAYCDSDQTMKCCNHACRLRSQVVKKGSMSSQPRPVTKSTIWKALAMGKRPAEVCCRDVIVMDGDGQWECRTNALSTGEMLQQMERGPMEHRRDMLGKSLMHYYQAGLKPLEDDFQFSHFYQTPFNMGEAMSKPLVMTLGGYSTGKTTFIKSLLGTNYKGMRIGPEPTTDRFTVLQYGQENTIIPGEVLSVDEDQMFTSLQRLGSSFLRNFDMATAPSEILRSVSILDTPGVLAGEKQNSREYDYIKAVQWFAQRADMILLFFDVQKIDIWDELKEVIQNLGENSQKVRIVLNRADALAPSDLMRAYGGLMWGLRKVFHTPEVKPIHIGSFHDEEYKPISEKMHFLFDQAKDTLMEEILDLSKENGVSKVGNFIRRAKLAKAHAMLLTHLKEKMPWFWGKGKQQAKLIDHLPEVYKNVAAQNDLPVGDLPAYEDMQKKLETIKFSEIKQLKSKRMDRIEAILSAHIPQLAATVRKAFIRQADSSGWSLPGSNESSSIEGFELGKRECVGHDVHIQANHHPALRGQECEVSGAKGRICMTSNLDAKPEKPVPRAECCGGVASMVHDKKTPGALFYQCHGANEGESCMLRAKSSRGWYRKHDLGSGCGSKLKCTTDGCTKKGW